MSREKFRRHVRVFGDVPVPEGELHAPPPKPGAAAADAPLAAPAGLVLKYVGIGVEVETLKLYEATIRATREGDKSWWQLWFHVRRETDGKDAVFVVPVNPGGPFIEDGPGGKTWGLTRTNDPSAWNVSPSINVLQGETGHEVHPGELAGRASLWHQVVHLANVQGDQAWMGGPPPPDAATEPEEPGYAQVPMAPPPSPAAE